MLIEIAMHQRHIRQLSIVEVNRLNAILPKRTSGALVVFRCGLTNRLSDEDEIASDHCLSVVFDEGEHKGTFAKEMLAVVASLHN